MNPANFAPYEDPNGGQWIEMKHESCKGIVWRPTEIQFTEDNQLSFQVEYFEGPGIPKVTDENWPDFSRIVQKFMQETLEQEAAELSAIAEAELEKEEQTEQGVSDELLAHIQGMDVLEGGHKVSEAMLPQDVQGDLAQISSVLGGLAPK